MCLLDMKEELPMSTSTSPLELLRPMTILLCRIMYSNSRVSSRAMGALEVVVVVTAAVAVPVSTPAGSTLLLFGLVPPCPPLLLQEHATLDGEAGADFRANNAQASLSLAAVVVDVDMVMMYSFSNQIQVEKKEGWIEASKITRCQEIVVVVEDQSNPYGGMRRVKKRVCLHHSRVLLFTLSSVGDFSLFWWQISDLNDSNGGTLMIRAMIYEMRYQHHGRKQRASVREGDTRAATESRDDGFRSFSPLLLQVVQTMILMMMT